MRFEWEDFKKYDDGSQSTWCNFKVFDDEGKLITHGHVEDHTLESAKESDRRCKRDVYYAYSISDPYHYILIDVLQTVFAEHGFSKEDHGTSGYNAYGICANEATENNPSEYVGTPKCSIYEVKDMVEEAFCKSLYFDYDKKFEEMKKELDERKALMDSAKEYLKKKR